MREVEAAERNSQLPTAGGEEQSRGQSCGCRFLERKKSNCLSTVFTLKQP